MMTMSPPWVQSHLKNRQSKKGMNTLSWYLSNINGHDLETRYAFMTQNTTEIQICYSHASHMTGGTQVKSMHFWARCWYGINLALSWPQWWKNSSRHQLPPPLFCTTFNHGLLGLVLCYHSLLPSCIGISLHLHARIHRSQPSTAMHHLCQKNLNYDRSVTCREIVSSFLLEIKRSRYNSTSHHKYSRANWWPPEPGHFLFK